MRNSDNKDPNSSDPVYLAHGISSWDVFVFMLAIIFQIVGIIGVFSIISEYVYSLIRYENHIRDYVDEASQFIFVFIVFILIGLLKSKNKMYKLIMERRENPEINGHELNNADKKNYFLKYSTRSILDITSMILILVAIVFWYLV